MIAILLCLMCVTSAQYQWCTLVPPVYRQPMTTDPLNKWSTITPFDKEITHSEKTIFEYITDNLLEGDVLNEDYMNTNEQSFDRSFSAQSTSGTVNPHDKHIKFK